MKKIAFLFTAIIICSQVYSQKLPEKPSACGVYDVDAYVEKCFDFYYNAYDINMKVKAMDIDISGKNLTSDMKNSKRNELRSYESRLKQEQKLSEELLAASSTMPDKLKEGASSNPLKSAKGAKNLTKASGALKEGIRENTEALANIPKVLEKMKY
jgi:hypothetical protein